MSAPAGAPATTTGRALRSLHAEWTKLRTVRSTGWLLLATVALTVVTTIAMSAPVDVDQCPTPAACYEDTTRLSLFGVRVGQAAVVVLAALAVTDEYGTRLVQATLAATPRRATVLLTKAAAVTGVVLAVGTLAVAGSLLAGGVILPANGFTAANGYPPLSLADEPTLRAAVGSVLYLGLVGLLTLGIGAALRDAAGTITAVLSLLYAFPVVLAFVADPRWQERIGKLAPMPAGLAVQATEGLDRLPIRPLAGLGVLAAWALVAMVVGVIVFRIRDA